MSEKVLCEKSDLVAIAAAVREATGSAENYNVSELSAATIEAISTGGGGGGFSPVVAVEDITGGHRMTITDKDGEKTFDVMDGKDGVDGEPGADGKSAYQYAVDGGYTGTEEEFAEKLASESGGVTSWNDLTDRPFYEKPDEYEITWDGNIEGRIAIDMAVLGQSGFYLVKVSDKVYTKEELIGKIIVVQDGTDRIISENDVISDLPGAFLIPDSALGVVYSADQLSAAFNAPDGYIENGTYFMTAPSMGFYVSALYTKGYLVKMDEKFLPSSTLQKIEIEPSESEGLMCVVDSGWSTPITYQEGSPWENAAGNILNVGVYVSVNGGVEYYSMECVFVMSGPIYPSGSCFRALEADQKLHDIQVFIRLNQTLKTVELAAKTLTI